MDEVTRAQEDAVRRYRKQYDDAGWQVTVDQARETVVLSAYGGPRAFQSLFIAPDGSVTSGPMA